MRCNLALDSKLQLSSKNSSPATDYDCLKSWKSFTDPKNDLGILLSDELSTEMGFFSKEPGLYIHSPRRWATHSQKCCCDRVFS
jgi:hypothetical protein